jgi:protein CMS1
LVETTDLVRPISAAAAPPVELADYLAARQLKTFSKYSQIELLDMQIPGMSTRFYMSLVFSHFSDTAIADTTAWTDDRTLDRLVDFITKSEYPSHSLPFIY